uniref:Integrase catalytic domain-containing protein n=1 Tax=Fagus sylvatica TaxID=28930 RepID=A0A2N9FJ35_FAGSY
MQRGDSMQKHLRKMSAMVHELKVAGNNLTDEQTCHVILSLRQSVMWRKDRVLPSLLDMVSARHLRPSAKVMKKHPKRCQNGGKPSKRANTTKRPRGKRGGRKQVEQACFNCGVVGHFAYTGATDHIARDRVGFVEYRRVPTGSRWMRMGNESRVEVLGIGTYTLQLRRGHALLFHDGLYTPGIRQNLLLVNMIIYFIWIDYSAYDSSFVLLTQNDYDEMNWHARLGHIGQDRMTRLAREGLLGPLAKVNLPTCEHCLARKSTRKPFGKGIRTTVPLELIHSNVCGPMNVRARHGASYFITFIDDFTRYGHVYLVSHKSEALDCFRRFMNLVENQIERTVKTLRTDHGREYLSKQFRELCENKRIHRQLTILGTPQQNGVAERRNRTLLDMHLDEGVTEIVSRDVEFTENDFSSRGDCGNVPRQRFGIEGESFTSAAQDDTEPKSYDEAMSSLACNEWMTAMKNEMKSMRTNQVRELVDLPLGRKSIGNKWVLKIKRKADGSIDKYKARLVAKAMVASLDLEFHQMDVKTAFLNRELDEEIFMDQLIDPQRPFEEWLSLTFEMKDMGEASFVLDIKILRDRSRKLLGLSQETYIRKVLKRFHMQDCKPIDTPVGKGDSLNICFAVRLVSRFQSNPGPVYWKVVKRILRYLCGTADYMLCYQGRDLRLRGYSDADWAGDLDERKSTSGYTFLLGGGAITWCNKKQSCVAHSTMESEYVACSAAVQEAVWLRRFLQRLDVVASAMDPVTIYSDSMATLAYPGEARCEFSQTLKESGLMKNSSRALGVTGLRSVRWKYQDAFMTYAPLRMEEKSTATCDHTICARNDHQIGR